MPSNGAKATVMPGKSTQEPFPDHGHDHDRCIEDAFDRAERLCKQNGLRLTDLRRSVLEIIWQSHRPIGAYDILDRMRDRGRRAAPMTVYRTLDFLMENRLVHRLASQNAYIGCDHPEEAHRGQFLICRTCGVVGELSDPRIVAAIRETAATTGFSVEAPVVEVGGLCRECKDSDEAGHGNA
jgi:Fur family zinc uptake transcriptional regulator